MSTKQTLFSFAILITGLYSCTQSKKETSVSNLAVADSIKTSIKGCYLYTVNKDTFQLAITAVNKNDVEGSIIYNFYEKDKNSGTIAGVIKGDTILADYTFNSEGTSSVREVIFIRKGDQLAEGYGPMEEKGGRTVFTDKSKVKFGDYILLSPIECK